MNDTYKIRSIGGCLVVTLPQRVVRQVGLRAGDEVRIAVTVDRTVTIKKPRGKSR